MFCVVTGLLALAVVLSANRTLTPERCPTSFDQGQVDQAWAGILTDAVANGRVDYDTVAAHRDNLEFVVCAIAAHQPVDSLTEDLAFLLNAYNALVLYAVLETGLTQSVHDLHVPLVPIDGYGFFYSLRFIVQGERMNLYALEHEQIRARYADGRIHMALNCASASCPVLQPRAFEAGTLDEQLAEATHAFVADESNVMVDESTRAIRLSSLFSWYAADFENHARSLGFGDSAIDWIIGHADEPSAALLGTARDEGWEIVFVPYDWGLNAVTSR
jgi:hypothetical protein